MSLGSRLERKSLGGDELFCVPFKNGVSTMVLLVVSEEALVVMTLVVVVEDVVVTAFAVVVEAVVVPVVEDVVVTAFVEVVAVVVVTVFNTLVGAVLGISIVIVSAFSTEQWKVNLSIRKQFTSLNWTILTTRAFGAAVTYPQPLAFSLPCRTV